MNTGPQFGLLNTSPPSRKLTNAAALAFCSLFIAGMNWDVSTELERDRHGNPTGMRVNRPVYFGDEIFHFNPRSHQTQIASKVRFPPNGVPPSLVVDFDRQEHRLNTDWGPDVLANFNFFSPKTKGEYVVKITTEALLHGLDPALAQKHENTVRNALDGKPPLLPPTKEFKLEISLPR